MQGVAEAWLRAPRVRQSDGAHHRTLERKLELSEEGLQE